MSERLVTFEQDGPIGVITLRRPEKFNALDIPMLRALETAPAATGGTTEPAAEPETADPVPPAPKPKVEGSRASANLAASPRPCACAEGETLTSATARDR